jgi:hypothetical protein
MQTSQKLYVKSSPLDSKTSRLRVITTVAWSKITTTVTKEVNAFIVSTRLDFHDTEYKIYLPGHSRCPL